MAKKKSNPRQWAELFGIDSVIDGLWERFTKDNDEWLKKKKFISPVPEDSVSKLESMVTPTPTPEPLPEGTFDFSDYEVRKPGFEGVEIPQPENKEIGDAIWKVFGPRNEATPAAAVAWSESGYDPTAVGQNYNEAGEPTSKDYGNMQINDRTFNGLLQRRAPEMQAIGARSVEDLKDPLINAQVGELVRKDEEWSGQDPFMRWFGWQGKNKEGKYLGKDINLQEMIDALK